MNFFTDYTGMGMQTEIGDGRKLMENPVQTTSDNYSKILDSELKVRILMMLLIYPELTLTQLSRKMGRVKSTISKHASELMELGLINQREQKVRGSIQQKVYSAVKRHGYKGKTYRDLKMESPQAFLNHLREEYLVNLRFFSYIQETNRQILHYINNFYSSLKPEDITDEFKEDVYRYNTCIPRLKFMTKNEYIEYREKFLEFEKEFITSMEQKRIQKHNEEPKEYLAITELLPIRLVLDYALKRKKIKII